MIYLSLSSSSPTGLGSGRRLMIIRTLDKLADYDMTIHNTSSFYEVEAEPELHAPSFVTVVAEIETEKEPIDVLQDCKLIEYQMGRSRNRPGTPRAIDIDLLAYHDVVDERLGITVPHERLTKHLSYLVPMKEINPDWTHPVSGKTIKHLVENSPSRQEIKKIENIDHSKNIPFFGKDNRD